MMDLLLGIVAICGLMVLVCAVAEKLPKKASKLLMRIFDK